MSLLLSELKVYLPANIFLAKLFLYLIHKLFPDGFTGLHHQFTGKSRKLTY
jgi:hypothetical protein